MQQLELSLGEFVYIVRVCNGVLLNRHTATLDLKHFLASRLSADWPETVARIVQFDDGQMEALRQEILAVV